MISEEEVEEKLNVEYTYLPSNYFNDSDNNEIADNVNK